ncbi:hypothetical protein NL108_007787 [Boleophthalmus pectinirostris]|nr:hypothetical protein NL108_007787 [Boleophthalmus pectinirostris]
MSYCIHRNKQVTEPPTKRSHSAPLRCIQTVCLISSLPNPFSTLIPSLSLASLQSWFLLCYLRSSASVAMVMCDFYKPGSPSNVSPVLGGCFCLLLHSVSAEEVSIVEGTGAGDEAFVFVPCHFHCFAPSPGSPLCPGDPIYHSSSRLQPPTSHQGRTRCFLSIHFIQLICIFCFV